jgi:hypothetical protein
MSDLYPNDLIFVTPNRFEAEIDNHWINAINALATRQGGYGQPIDPEKIFSNPAPLVELLRNGDVPMPLSIRRALADLFIPDDPPKWDFMLVPKRVAGFDRMIGPELDAVYSYAESRERDAEKSSESAAEEAGKDHLIDARTINRYRAKLKRLGERLRESH